MMPYYYLLTFFLFYDGLDDDGGGRRTRCRMHACTQKIPWSGDGRDSSFRTWWATFTSHIEPAFGKTTKKKIKK